MEFRNPLEEYSDDDDDGALSPCDLVTEQGQQEIVLRDSNAGFLEEEGFVFDFWCGSKTDHISPADDLFRHGRLLPLALQRCRTESVHYSSFEMSNLENMLTWRNDSLDLQSSLWSISSSSQRKSHSGEVLPLGNSKSKGKHRPPASGGKISAKRRVLTPGLMTAPPTKLEDLRLRQAKTTNNINGAKNLDLRRSVICNYDKNLKLGGKKAKAVSYEEKRRSVKEHVVVKKTGWLNGWKTLTRLPSFNNCKTSSIAVVDVGRLQTACKIAARSR